MIRTLRTGIIAVAKWLIASALLMMAITSYAGPTFKIVEIGGISQNLITSNNHFEYFARIWLDQSIQCGSSTVNMIVVGLGVLKPGGSDTHIFTNYATLVNATEKQLTVEVWDIGQLGMSSQGCTLHPDLHPNPFKVIYP